MPLLELVCRRYAAKFKSEASITRSVCAQQQVSKHTWHPCMHKRKHSCQHSSLALIFHISGYFLTRPPPEQPGIEEIDGLERGGRVGTKAQCRHLAIFSVAMGSYCS